MNTTQMRGLRGIFAQYSIVTLAIGLLVMVGCSNQPTDPELATADIATSQKIASAETGDMDPAIDETMQISPHMINLQSKGTSESVRAIIGLTIPGGYYITDFGFTLSFNDEDVTDAYDCYYCYVDDNLIISFAKDEILASPVTIGLDDTEVVAAVNGYFRVESEDDGYDTDLSTVAMVEIISPAKSVSSPTSEAPTGN